MRRNTLLVLAVLTVLAYGPGTACADDAEARAGQAAGASPAAAKPAGPVPPEAMEGLSFEGLTPEQRALAVSILNEQDCDCGCGMKLAVCRRDDSTCTRSLGLGRQVIAQARDGKSRESIVKEIAAPSHKFVEFALGPGDAPAVGPADAKVTILHYLDYQ